MHWNLQKVFCVLDLSSQEGIGLYPQIKHGRSQLCSLAQALSGESQKTISLKRISMEHKAIRTICQGITEIHKMKCTLG